MSKIEELKKIALLGDPEAQYNVGECYYDGDGVEQDFVEAVRWYKKAADQGHAKAQYSLGFCYAKGKGVGQDYGQARVWWLKAADQGHAKAQHNLACCYDEALGGQEDFVEAVRWYKKAADQGVAESQCNLGLCYGKGYGVEQDFEEAEKWLTKAAEQGQFRAKEVLQRLHCEADHERVERQKAADLKYAQEQRKREWAQRDKNHKKRFPILLLIQIGVTIPLLLALCLFSTETYFFCWDMISKSVVFILLSMHLVSFALLYFNKSFLVALGAIGSIGGFLFSLFVGLMAFAGPDPYWQFWPPDVAAGFGYLYTLGTIITAGIYIISEA